jgi:hypothetical protein
VSQPGRRALAILCLSLGSSPSLLAQRSDRGTIGGIVTDAQGAALPGASVTVRNEATGVESVLATNHAGAYSSTPLVLGPYSITVSQSGFKKAVVTGVDLRAGGCAPPRRRARDRRDGVKVNPTLTLTAGLRLDYQTARTEQNDEYSTFDPTTPNPGAGNLPGAVIFAGTGPGRAGTRTFEDPK